MLTENTTTKDIDTPRFKEKSQKTTREKKRKEEKKNSRTKPKD